MRTIIRRLRRVRVEMLNFDFKAELTILYCYYVEKNGRGMGR